MSLYEMTDPDFTIEFRPDVTGTMQEIQLINCRTKQYITRLAYVDFEDAMQPNFNFFLLVIDRMWRELARVPKDNP